MLILDFDVIKMAETKGSQKTQAKSAVDKWVLSLVSCGDVAPAEKPQDSPGLWHLLLSCIKEREACEGSTVESCNPNKDKGNVNVNDLQVRSAWCLLCLASALLPHGE